MTVGQKVQLAFIRGILAAPDSSLCKVEGAEDNSEHVVEIVRQAARQLADGFELLHLALGFFSGDARFDFSRNARFQCCVDFAQEVVGRSCALCC